MDKTVKKYVGFFWGTVIITALISATILNRFSYLKNYELLKAYIVVLLFLVAFEVISITNHFPFFNKKESVKDLCIGYALSSLLLCVNQMVSIYFLWMIGSIYIAKKINSYVGIVFHFIFTFLLCSFHAYGVETFIYNFMIGCMLCLLISLADSLLSFFYVFIIVGSIQVILTLLLHNFFLKDALTFNALSTVLSGWMLVICGFFIRTKEGENDCLAATVETNPIMSEAKGVEETKEIEVIKESIKEPIKESIKEPIKESIKELEQVEEREDYLPFITSDAPLMKRLYQERPQTYRHSLLIGILSEKAAIKIGADGLLAKAGGLYHEIYKLEDKKDIKDLPPSLLAITRQQNGKADKPSSKEAAIVLLSDSIISTIKYFEKQPKENKRSNDKIINDIFRVRLEQGVLDNASLTIEEFQTLKEFYRSNLPKGEKK